jgi:hypothetical protein
MGSSKNCKYRIAIVFINCYSLLFSFTKSNSTKVGFLRISCHVLLHHLGRTLNRIVHVSLGVKILEFLYVYLYKIGTLSMVNRKHFSAIQFIKMIIHFNKTNKVKIDRFIFIWGLFIKYQSSKYHVSQ